MRIAILYICTGRYAIFWDVFFQSCEQYFLSAHERHYFVFTENDIPYVSNERVHKIEQPYLGWPYDTLKRFHMFSRIREELAAFDYIFFFNANCEFRMAVNESVLPTEDEGLVVTQHPGYYNKSRDKYTYERNAASRAYIPYGQGEHYVCGGVNGGRAHAYLALINGLREAVDEDERNGIIARWHDESHLNRYILGMGYKLLSPSFCYPENWRLPFEEIIRVREKTLHGGHKFLRYEKEAAKWKALIKKLFRPDMKKSHPINRQAVITSLMGGLGNQMFQYAAGRTLALRLGVPLKLDFSWFSSIARRDARRAYMLNSFSNMREVAATKKEIKNLVYSPRRLHDRLLFRSRRYAASYVTEPHYRYWEGFEQINSPVYLFGYWQNESYFRSAAYAIRRDFMFPPLPAGPSEEMAGRIQSSNNAVAVHIRRGDYVSNPKTNKFHGLCTPEYYSKALAKVLSLAGGEAELFLFSDDPAWVKEHFDTQGLAANVIFFPNHLASPWHDMHLMSLCTHHIIANSSFSWWGAWLSEKDGVVCAPERWFAAPGKQNDTPVPARWIKI